MVKQDNTRYPRVSNLVTHYNTAMIDRVFKRIEDDKVAAVARLCDLLRIPSVSAVQKHEGDCKKAAEWVAAQLKECGLDVAVYPTPGKPVVLGRYDGAGGDASRLLFYGHYDVQPPEPLELWKTGPFEPTIRDGRLYARGASDDKGQVMCFIEALRAWKRAAGAPPINVTVLIEGEEEVGSVNLDAFIESHKAELKADIVAVSDTAMWDAQTPAITYALRGLLYMEVKLHGPNRDLHSGTYGGTVPNPATELALVLGQLLDKKHGVTIEGFYDDVRQVTTQEKKQWEKLGFREKDWAASVGLAQLHGEQGYTTLERRWARPSCDINGLYGGYGGQGAKTVIPSFAGAKISFRLVPDQDPAKIEVAFRKWFEVRTPPGCRWEVTSHSGAPPVMVCTDSPYLDAARRAVSHAFGKPPVLVRDGATIPVGATFKKLLGLDTLFIGFGLNDDNLHSPNEKFDLANFHRGCLTHAALLDELKPVSR